MIDLELTEIVLEGDGGGRVLGDEGEGPRADVHLGVAHRPDLGAVGVGEREPAAIGIGRGVEGAEATRERDGHGRVGLIAGEERVDEVPVKEGLAAGVVEKAGGDGGGGAELIVGAEADAGDETVIGAVATVVVAEGRVGVDRILVLEEILVELANDLLVGGIDGEGEIAGAAQHIEDLGIAHGTGVAEGALAVGGGALFLRGRVVIAVAVVETAALLHRERGAGLQVDLGSEAVGAFVGRLAVDDLDGLEA